jgi:hypothetical protein
MRDVLFRLFVGLLLLPATTVAWSVASVGSRLATRRSTALFMSTVPLPPPLFPEFNRPTENHQVENDAVPSEDESSFESASGNSVAPVGLAWNRRQVLALASSGVAAAAAVTVTSRFWSRPLRRHENAWPLSRSSPLPPRVVETLLPSLTVADEAPSATDWSQLSTTSALGWPHGPAVSPLPSANAATPSLSDLERALQEQSKRRVIDPRTHG